MKEEHIKNLIEKYNSGTSSLQEDKLLFDSINANSSIEKLATFVKKTKRKTPEKFNENLWESFEKKTKKTNKYRIGIFSTAASIILLLSIYISNNNQNELTISEKEALLNEAKSMFTAVNQEEIIHNIIIENDLVVVYTKTE